MPRLRKAKKATQAGLPVASGSAGSKDERNVVDGENAAADASAERTTPGNKRARDSVTPHRDSDAESASNKRSKKKRKTVQQRQGEPSPTKPASNNGKDKGKGKAVDPVTLQLQAELDQKNAVIATQSALLASFKNALVCHVCLETLDRPYTLSCGHVFCRKCLIGWFHRPDPEAHYHADTETSDTEAYTSSSSSSTSSDSSSEGSSAAAVERAATRVSTAPSDSSSSDESSSSDDDSSEDGDTNEPREVLRGELLGRPFDVVGRNDDATWSAMERQFENAVPAIIAASDAQRASNGRLIGAAPATNGTNLDELRAARLARLGVGNAPTQAETGSAVVEPAPVATSSTSRAEPAAVPTPAAPTAIPFAAPTPPVIPFAAPTPPAAPAAVIVSSSSSSSSSDESADEPPHVIPRGEHRLKNLICPQCRVPVVDAPFRVFVMSEMVLLLRNAEANGLLPRSGSAEPSHSAGPTAAAGTSANATGTTSHVDRLPGLDDTDMTWGGLFTNEGKEPAREQRARYARVVEDRDDGVRRCFDCNWEIDEDTGMCNGCGRQWELGSDDGSGDSVGFVIPWGGSLTGGRGRHTDSEEEEDDEDEEASHDSFIVGSDEEIEQTSQDDIVFPGDDSDSSNSSGGSRGRKRDRQKREPERDRRRARRIVIDSDDPDASSDESNADNKRLVISSDPSSHDDGESE